MRCLSNQNKASGETQDCSAFMREFQECVTEKKRELVEEWEKKKNQ